MKNDSEIMRSIFNIFSRPGYFILTHTVEPLIGDENNLDSKGAASAWSVTELIH